MLATKVQGINFTPSHVIFFMSVCLCKGYLRNKYHVGFKLNKVDTGTKFDVQGHCKSYLG